MLNHRASNILKQQGSNAEAQFGNSYKVTVTPAGGRVASASAGSTVTVDAGHSFRPGDKFLRNPGTDDEYSDTIDSVTATTIVFASATYSVSVGDLLVNLGPDTSGGATPNYDASPVKAYSDPDGTTAISNATITADSLGNYAYYIKGDGRVWELVRDASGDPVDVVQGFGAVAGRINIADFGAAVDGSTDDKQAFRAAIRAGNALDAAVYVPPGVCAANSNILVDVRVEIFGAGIDRSSVITGSGWTNADDDTDVGYSQDTSSTDLFLVTASYTQIHDLTLVGPAEADTSVSNEGIECDTSAGDIADLKLYRLDISAFRHGIAATDVDTLNALNRCEFNSCIIHDCESIGIQLKYGTSRNIMIYGNVFYGNNVNIGLDEDTNRCNVIGNQLFASNGSNVSLNQAADYNVIASNFIQGGTNGVFIGGATTTSKHNIVIGNTMTEQTSNAISISAASNNVIANNVIDQAGANGIAVGGNASNNADFNMISGNWIGAATDHAIRITATLQAQCNETIITNNVCKGAGLSGIQCNAGLDMFVSGNRCFDNADYGLQIDASAAYVFATNNDLRGNTTGPIQQNSSGTGIVLQGNRVWDELPVSFTDADATPSVLAANVFKEANTGATTITDFDDGLSGQEILVIFTTGNTTLVDGSGLELSGGANKTFVANDTARFVYDGTNWLEVTRSENHA